MTRISATPTQKGDKMKRIGFVKFFTMLAALILAAALCACSPSGVGALEAKTGLKFGEGALIASQKDTHGGFHGDGESLTVVRLSQGEAKKLANGGALAPTPLDEALFRFVYGDFLPHDNLIHEIPPIANGAYLLRDRFAEQYPAEAAAPIFERAAINLTLVIVDIDGDAVYIFDIDT